MKKNGRALTRKSQVPFQFYLTKADGSQADQRSGGNLSKTIKNTPMDSIGGQWPSVQADNSCRWFTTVMDVVWSRQPPVMFIRHVGRRAGFKRSILVYFERSLDDYQELPIEADIAFMTLDGSSFRQILEQGSIPDIFFVSPGYKPFQKRYASIRRARMDECTSRVDRGDVGFLALEGDKVVGWIWVCLQEEKYEPAIETNIKFGPSTSMIYGLYITAEQRGKGYATLLLKHAMNYLAQKQYSNIAAVVEHDNLPSQRSFVRLGFVPTKRIKRVRVPGYTKLSEHNVPQPEG